MKYQLLSPVTSFSCRDVDFDESKVNYLFTPDISIEHLENEKFEGAKNVHRLHFKWNYELKDNGVTILRALTEQTAFLYNIPCEDFRDKLISLNIVSLTAAKLEFELATLRTKFSNVLFPPVHEQIGKLLDEITEISDLLEAS